MGLSNMNSFSEMEVLGTFFLMNKDVVLAKFEVISILGTQKVQLIECYQKMPLWIPDIPDFIINRRAPKHRENIEKLLKMSGCDTILGYLSITHALSLIDTFWVKAADSELVWNDVSLYDKPFNETIARTAFEGGLPGLNLSDTSPEYGTDGTYAKCWIRENGIIRLLKRGSSGARNAGLEPYSEYYSSQISRELGLDAVQYGLQSHDSLVCSVCDCFTDEEFGYLPYSALDKTYSTYVDVIGFYAKYGLEEFARDMFVFDAVIFNEDRHKGNFGFLVRNETQEIVAPAPLFDHNVAMLCYAEQEDFDKIDAYLAEKGPRIGNSFVQDARYLMTPSMRKKLIRLQGFQFERHPKLNLPEWRLERLENLINLQIRMILE